jgi:hypothetical protein
LSPDIAVGPDRIPICVWEAQADMWWSRWDPECNCWITPSLVHAPNTLVDEYPRVSIAPDGVPWVVWAQYQGGGVWATLATRFLQGSWSVPDTVIKPSGTNDAYDLVAVSGNECWVVSDGSTTQTGLQKVILVRHREKGAWVEYGPLSARLGTGHHDYYPTAAMDANGRLWVGWIHADLSDQKPYVTRLENGQWTTPEPMTWTGSQPQLAPLPTGEMMVIWTAYFGNDLDIAYQVWAGSWSEPGFVSAPDAPDDLDIGVQVTALGSSPVAVWVAGPSDQPTHRDIVASRWCGSTWSPEVVISVPDSIELALDEYPAVAMGLDGVAWASWQRWGPWPENPDQDIWYARGSSSTTATLEHESSPSASRGGRLIAAPNPAPSVAKLDFFIPSAGKYDLVVADVTGRVIDRIALGTLKAGVHSGDHAVEWPRRGMKTKRGVYTLSVRNSSTGQTVAKGKFVLAP